MSALRVIDPAMAATSRVLHRARESSRYLPALQRKPRIALRWIIGAWAAHAALIATVLFMSFVHPHARDAVLNAIAPPPSVGQRIAGALGGSSRSATLHRAGAFVIDGIAGVCGGGVILLLLLAHLPVTVVRAREDAESHERAADARATDSPAESMELYRSALHLVCDPEFEAALEQKIQSLAAPAPASAQATVRETAPASPGAMPSGASSAGGRYTILDKIGRGAYGVVFRAEDTVLGRQVALKQLPTADDETDRMRFQREARVLAMLSHPNIVQVYDLAEHDGQLWMAMELVEHGDLAAHLKRAGALPVADAVFLGSRVAEALACAHARGVVHRDLKPHNILMADARTPKVTDFGLAKLAEGSVHTVEGTVMGSPHYMSPEQADGRTVDPRSDIYALGVILYQMIGGTVPFTGDITSVLTQHIGRTPAPLSSLPSCGNVPAPVEHLVARMLAKAPLERPQDMQAVIAALDAIAHDLSLAAGAPESHP
ncbi:MAG TPA: serine/threonine-protein kinase [Candidatus Krumholzibacteria bacterium]|nr:serine/threonine-protein kinase [Candidatus Krumholzibacteria bacterium]